METFDDAYYGKIHPRFDAWCGKCMTDEYLQTNTPKRAKGMLIERGWKKKKGRWYCPKCAAEKGHPPEPRKEKVMVVDVSRRMLREPIDWQSVVDDENQG